VSHPLAAGTDVLGWSFEPAVVGPALVTGALYVRGWARASRRMPGRFDGRRLGAFLAGLGAVAIAVVSPLDALAGQFLQAHMVQHLLLMLVAPPLLWLGAPVAPLLLGLPRPLRRAVARGLAAMPVRRLGAALGHPAVAWGAFALVFWVWHLPALYDLALRSDVWHHVEHACFFSAALLFWRPVILAWPARAVWPRWAMIPYLVLAEVQNTALAAILTFTDRVIYPAYSSLEDQALAGVIMWVPGSVAFLLPTLWLVVQTIAPARPVPIVATKPPLV
jgi:cytochrome c oxidase assembly factor CtaG